MATAEDVVLNWNREWLKLSYLRVQSNKNVMFERK